MLTRKRIKKAPVKRSPCMPRADLELSTIYPRISAVLRKALQKSLQSTSIVRAFGKLEEPAPCYQVRSSCNGERTKRPCCSKEEKLRCYGSALARPAERDPQAVGSGRSSDAFRIGLSSSRCRAATTPFHVAGGTHNSLMLRNLAVKHLCNPGGRLRSPKGNRADH